MSKLEDSSPNGTRRRCHDANQVAIQVATPENRAQIEETPQSLMPPSPTPSVRSKISLERDALNWSDLGSRFGTKDMGSRKSISMSVVAKATGVEGFSLSTFVRSLLPCIVWLPKYKVCEYLPTDILVGITVAVLHVPQGLAYGLLAGLSPLNGLYVSFFPVIIYSFMGTSRHISHGTLALTSIMIYDSLMELGCFDAVDPNCAKDCPPTPEEAATAICMTTGLLLLVFGVLKLGCLSLLLSDTMVSAYLCGASFHVATSQLSNVLGFSAEVDKGPVVLLRTWYVLVMRCVGETNLVTLLVCLIAGAVLVICKDLVLPRLVKRFSIKLPIPVDLVVIISATAISYGLDLGGNYSVKIMGEIPTGLPYPKVPRFDLMGKVLTNSVALAVVSYSVSLSLAKIYAKKHKYTVSPNQELIAMGVADVFASFFGCYPMGAAITRSAVQERSGVKSLLAGLVSCLAILVVLLFLGPLFSSLPKAILSAVILVALKGTFLQVADFWSCWKLSRYEAASWMCTFLAVLLFDVDYGLVIGLAISLSIVLIRLVLPRYALLGILPETEIFVNVANFELATQLPGIKIFQYNCALFFMNRENFKSVLFERTLNLSSEDLFEISEDTKKTLNAENVHTVIIDCSTISYLDIAGVETISEVVVSLKDLGISCFLVSCPTQLLYIFERTKLIEKVQGKNFGLFPSIHDAIAHCTEGSKPKENFLT